MKINQIIWRAGILIIALCATAFIHPETELSANTSPVEVAFEMETNNKTFAEFLSYFEKVETPFGVSLNNLDQFEALKVNREEENITNLKLKHQKHYIPELAMGGYSRMGPPSVEPVARFYTKDQTIAVIYMTYYPFQFSDNLNFSLCIYDFYGNQLSHQKQGDMRFKQPFHLGNVSLRSTHTFSINSEGNIWINRYENIWKEDIQQKGIENNEIVDYKLVTTDVFKIKPDGLIEQIEAYSLANRVSLD